MTNELYTILYQPKRVSEHIDRLRGKQTSLRYSLLPSGINYGGDRVQTSPTDSTAAVFGEIDEIAWQIRSLEAKRSDAEKEVKALAASLNNAKMYDLIVRKYCRLNSLGVIACDTGESIDCIKQRHSRAIKSLEKTISD